MPEANLAPIVTPHGRLMVAPAEGAPPLAEDLARRIETAFARGTGHGLLQLGAGEVGVALPPLFAYWREFAARYVTALCALPEAEAAGPLGPIAAPGTEVLVTLVTDAPPMTGSEYLTAAVLRASWRALDEALREELAESKLALPEFLGRRNSAWHLVGRVCFNLAENRGDEEAPFAFLATYTAKLSAQAKAQHLPLAQALREYAGAKNKARLLSLLLPVQRAAGKCAWVKAMVDAGEIYHPLRWTPAEALRFLAEVPRIEAAGVVVRMPGVIAGQGRWPRHRDDLLGKGLVPEPRALQRLLQPPAAWPKLRAQRRGDRPEDRRRCGRGARVRLVALQDDCHGVGVAEATVAGDRRGLRGHGGGLPRPIRSMVSSNPD
ncbi:MAG: hypothetical protein ABIR98_07945 [Usitatibacter sp.]